ncbi:hypothetical protein HPP92_020526 [Vanilla planifolia]|uniref:Eukaryotic translation initiation factor 4G n=1 Tax=Vanilla planifolia TaxID=51239 RepID=A0A835PX78_VANPL|nr:hypothetical protein HPP92_020916 [Vanilla planifolia]KAG0462050.1 hypothetical protein HPP92_020526 [Vanilla planifolia]
MSQNQSRGEKTEGNLRKPGRSGSFGQNRGFSGGGKGGGGVGASAPGPALSSSATLPPSPATHELLSNRSFKNSVDGQGGQIRVNPGSSNSDAGQRSVPSGASAAAPLQANTKKNFRAVPKAPAAHSAATSGNESGPFLQFGTINPGIVNGMQVPARTCSAPPNLDEQKRDQAFHDSFRAAPTLPIPSASKPQHAQPIGQPLQQAAKDVGAVSHADYRESQPSMHSKRDMHAPFASAPPSVTPTRPVLPVGGMPMHVTFQQPQVPVQFSGANLQIPSQGIVPSSLQMTMELPSGNVSQVPQTMFIPNIHSHALQPQTVMHQGQNLGFAPQLGHQLPQLGNMGIGIAPQFSQQQTGKVAPTRRAVRITHPETHEELKLDKRTDSHTDASSSGQRQLSNATSISPSLPTFGHQIGYYPPNYNPSAMFFTSSSLPMANAQMSTVPQATRYSYPVGQNGQSISYINPSLNAATSGRPGPPPTLNGLLEPVNLEGSSTSASLGAQAQATVTSGRLLPLEKGGTSDKEVALPKSATLKQINESVLADSSPATEKNQTASKIADHMNKNEVSAVASTGYAVISGNDVKKKESLKRSDSMKDQPKRSSKELKNSQLQVEESNCSSIGKDIDGHSVPNESASINSASVADSFTAATVFPSTSVESGVSKLDQEKDKVTTAEHLRDSQAVELPRGGGSCSSSDPMEVASDNSFIKEIGPLEVPSVSKADVDGIVCEPSCSSLQGGKTIVIDQKKDDSSGSVCETDDVLDGALLGSTTTVGTDPLSTSIDIFDGTIGTVNKVIVADSPVKKAGSEICDADNQQFASSVDDGNHISEILGKKLVLNTPSTAYIDRKVVEVVPTDYVSSTNVELEIAAYDPIIDNSVIKHAEDVAARKSNKSAEMVPMVSCSSETKQLLEIKTVEPYTGDQTMQPHSRHPEKPLSEPNKSKITERKKRKEILSKADAAGSSDLYDAYKGPGDKQETVNIPEVIESPSAVETKDYTDNESHNKVDETVLKEEQSKVEIEDWEDTDDVVAQISKISENVPQSHKEKMLDVQFEDESTRKKKYSRDFLLTFSEQCKDLPEGFEMGADPDIITSVHAGMFRGDRDILQSPGRITDRSPGASRGDRRSDDDKWMKVSNAFRMDLNHGVSTVNFRQGVNHGVLRNPRMQSPNVFSGGILSGPVQSLSSQGGTVRNNSDADRWQRAPGSQKGLMPPPQGPMQMMHKSTNKYEVGKVSDEEELKQRRLKAILNKLTPQNFEKLFAQVKEVNIDNVVTLNGVISQIFDKALMEPTFCQMYADFCFHLAAELPELVEDNERITFRRLLLNKCQVEFERGEREQAEADKAEEEGEIPQTEEEREEKRIQARRRMLGNIRLIGELYKKKMLTERIMHECIKKLLGQFQNPDEENIEALCKLMSTIGEMIDHVKAREHMDAYFDMMAKLSTNLKLSSRVRFMLKDTIDLRRNRWQQRRKVEGPKKIEDVHRDAAQERQAQAARSVRGPISSSRRGPPTDYGYKGSTGLSSPSSQLGGANRNLPGHARGPSSQDVRLDDRHPYESRVLSVPLSQRLSDDGSITLGPQGGLAKGMSGRGQGTLSNASLSEIAPRISDSHRLASGSNGFSSNPDQIHTTSREDSAIKFITDRSLSLGAAIDQRCLHDHTSDRAFDGSLLGSSGKRPASLDGKISEPEFLSEDKLRQKSMAAIMEFYSSRDEEEVVLCIRELNTPNFYPSMISLWVIDSFDRKSLERGLLSQLLVNLNKGHDSLFNQSQLIKGFESVLSLLEDAVNDSPKAAEFLGHMFGKVVVENVLPLREIGKLIREGGEYPGTLVEAGLGSEVLGCLLEFIKMEKGDMGLNDIRRSANLRFEDFRPPYPSAKSRKLDAFL